MIYLVSSSKSHRFGYTNVNTDFVHFTPVVKIIKIYLEIGTSIFDISFGVVSIDHCIIGI